MRKRKSDSRLPLQRRETRALLTHASHRLWSETPARPKHLRWWTPNPAPRKLNRPRMSSWKMEIHRPPRSRLLLRFAQNMSAQISASHTVGFFQSPWVPEIKALFDDVKKIAPKAAYDIIGSVPSWPPKQTSQIAHIYIGQDSISHSGNCQRTTSPRPPPDTRRKVLSCARSVDRRIQSMPWRTVRPIGRNVRGRRLIAQSGIDMHSSRRLLRRNLRRRRHRGGIR